MMPRLFGFPATCTRPIVQPPASMSSWSSSCSRCRRHGGVAADADADGNGEARRDAEYYIILFGEATRCKEDALDELPLRLCGSLGAELAEPLLRDRSHAGSHGGSAALARRLAPRWILKGATGSL